MDRKIDYLIVGQGIAGTILSYKLIKKGYLVKVIDDGHRTASSTKAAGIVNPITGRSYVKSWMIDELIPEAIRTYRSLENELKGKYYHEHTIVRVLGSIYEENKWSSRLLDDAYSKYIIEDYDTSSLDEHFKDVESCAIIKGGRVNLKSLLTDYRNWLIEQDALIESTFKSKHLRVLPRTMYYDDIEVGKIVFAEGVQSIDNQYFPNLPFQPNKGQVLIVEMSDYKIKDIVKHGIFICPIESNRYWVGSGYERDFEDDLPTKEGRNKLKEQLANILKSTEYKIIQHISGIRPSVKGRKPLLGKSNTNSSMYLFGGLGTKGSSLAPYWAGHLISYIEGKVDIHPEVDFNRF
ncbi:FAD-binding oxidoreductase [Saprospiraceae bacterium]|nr:FAD-binding oxidoreductase [Saprospiraceae bacterium]